MLRGLVVTFSGCSSLWDVTGYRTRRAEALVTSALHCCIQGRSMYGNLSEWMWMISPNVSYTGSSIFLFLRTYTTHGSWWLDAMHVHWVCRSWSWNVRMSEISSPRLMYPTTSDHTKLEAQAMAQIIRILWRPFAAQPQDLDSCLYVPHIPRSRLSVGRYYWTLANS